MADQHGASLEEILEDIRSQFVVDFEKLDVDGSQLEVLSINNMREHIDKLLLTKSVRQPLRDLPLWAKIWPASFVLGRFLRRYEPAGKSMLEIGAGMGICSLIASRYGFRRIVTTDVVPEAVNFARANVLRNNLEKVIEVRRLDVANSDAAEGQRFDIIAASEILYLDDLHRPLLKFVGRHLAEGGKVFFCTDLARNKPRFQKLAARDFAITEGKIGVKSLGEDGEEERRVFSMLVLEKKQG